MGDVINLFKEDGSDLRMNIFEIANAFLSMESMSNKKLQKLCYYTQAWYIALNNDPLIDCEFEAWTHGPVCPELYHTFKKYGYSNIQGRFECPEIINDDNYLKEFIGSIYAMYGKFQADELEEMTHNEDPWLNSREGLNEWEPGYNLISLDSMKKYYKNLRKYDN